MTDPSGVFISYSRRDYYFAESLAFHLAARGMPAWLDVKDLQPGTDWNASLETALDAAPVFILIASPDSLTSVHVRAEWTRARAAGKRIIAARFRGTALPSELKDIEVVDFRGWFGAAVGRLVATVRSPPTGARPSRASSVRLPFPPWVSAIGLLLAVLSVFPLAVADYGEVSDAAAATGDRLTSLVGAAAVVAAFIWFTWLAFLRRRMSSRHLVLTFVLYAVLTGYPLAERYYRGVVPDTFSASTRRVVNEMPEVPWLMLALAVGGLGIVGVVRPEDLLRWTPTGRAWSRLRLAQALRLEGRVAAIGARFGAIGTFDVLSDPVDRTAAERLRRELVAAGATEGGKDASGGTTVLLLTNRTRSSWVQEVGARQLDRLFTVVGTSIALPSTLDWLWKRQWLDFRSWSVDEVERHRGLPDIPESLDGVHLPPPVNRVHHVLCATTALMFAAAGAVMPEGELNSVSDVVPIAGYALSIVWALAGRRLIRRTVTFEGITRWFWPIALAGIVDGISTLALFVGLGGSMWRTLPCGLFLVAAPVWLWTYRDTIRFWFPVDARVAKDAMTAARNWRTSIRVALYTFAWFVILNPPGMQ